MNAVLPAAGLSRRMGTQKLLLPFGSGTVLEAVLRNLRLAGLTPVFCVLSEATRRALPPLGEDVDVRINPAPERGYSSSLAIGLDALPPGPFCLMLGDLPTARPGDMARLRRAFDRRPSGRTALAPCRGGRFGHPIFFEDLWRRRLRALTGDRGGRDLLRRYREELWTVDGPDGLFADLDTPEAYAALSEGAAVDFEKTGAM